VAFLFVPAALAQRVQPLFLVVLNGENQTENAYGRASGCERNGFLMNHQDSDAPPPVKADND
jgi:hypothetical protein